MENVAAVDSSTKFNGWMWMLAVQLDTDEVVPIHPPPPERRVATKSPGTSIPTFAHSADDAVGELGKRALTPKFTALASPPMLNLSCVDVVTCATVTSTDPPGPNISAGTHKPRMRVVARDSPAAVQSKVLIC